MERGIEPESFEIHVKGELTELILSAFDDLAATSKQGETILTGDLPDQAALFGVLEQIEALGLVLLEVRRSRPAPQGGSADTPSNQEGAGDSP